MTMRWTRRGLIASPLAAAWPRVASAAPAGVLRVGGFANDANLLDPHRSSAAQDSHVFSFLFNALIRFKPGSASAAVLEPDLAESWAASPDGLTWTFKLRPGVSFHRGFGTVTADDVVYSLQRAADPARSSFASNYTAFDSVEAIDPATVRIRLKSPVPSLLGLVADYQGGFIIPRRAGEQMGAAFQRRPIGTGPFAFVEHQPQQAVVMEAFREHFRGAPRIERVVYRFIDSDNTRELAYRAGELDLFYGRREQSFVDRFKKTPRTRVLVFGPAQSRLLHINTSVKPLDDLRVRRAIAHAIDTAELRESVGMDITTDAPSVVPVGNVGWTDQVPRYAHDPKRAKALLAEAGLAKGFKVHAIISQLSTLLQPMQVVQEQLRQVGIEVDLEIVDHPNFLPRIRANESALVLYGAARFPTADHFLTEFFLGANRAGKQGGGNNWSLTTVADADILAARSEPDRTRQDALWKAAQTKLLDQACAVPLFELAQVWAARDGLDLGYRLEGAMALGPAILPQTTLGT